MPEIIDKLVNAIVNNLPKIIEAGIKLIIALAGALIQAIPQLVSKIPQIISSLVTGLAQGVANMASVGLELVKGLWNGISNAQQWVMDKIKGFGKAILNGIKSFFGINSPSRVFRDEVGKNLGLGVGEGFTDAMVGVTKDMQAAIPSSFDTGVNINTTTTSSLANAGRRLGGAADTMGGLDLGTLTAAFTQARRGMNIVLDDQKVGSFVTDTIAREVYAQ